MSPIPILTFKLIVVSFVIAKRQLILDRSRQSTASSRSYDFIVVGGGTSGCVVASRLSENPNVNVLLLEAGAPANILYSDLRLLSDTLEITAAPVWPYYNEPGKYVGFQYPGGRINTWAGKLLGGSSSYNSYAYNRGNRGIYDRWQQQYGVIGWGYNEVMPYFLRSENNTDLSLVRKYPDYHSTTGPIKIYTYPNPPLFMRQLQRALNQFDGGFRNTDFNGPNQTGTGFVQLYSYSDCFRTSTATVPNLNIVTRAQVVKIIFNGSTAIGVVFNMNNMLKTVYARRDVILSAGPFNSPQLLMLSGVGLRDHLRSFSIPLVMELPVGNNFQNHASASIVVTITDPNYYIQMNTRSTLQQLSGVYLNNTGQLGLRPVLNLFWSTPSNQMRHNPNSLVAGLVATSGRSVAVNSIITRIRSRGTIRLQSASPYVAPRIDPNFLGDATDFKDMLYVLRSMFYILETPEFNLTSITALPTFESVGCTSCPGKYMYECTEGLKCFIHKSSIPANHPGGSCRMGAINRADVVVDPQLRVKNLNKLRICDSSVSPENPNCPIAATALMIGEKCAQIIKEYYHLN